jgi:hypothetical protein
MTVIDFIIKLANNPKMSDLFIEELKEVKTKDDLKKLLKKYKIKATDAEINKIFKHLKDLQNIENPINVKY